MSDTADGDGFLPIPHYPYHRATPDPDAPVPGPRPGSEELDRWNSLADAVDRHYEPDHDTYPEPWQHIVHHARAAGVADMPPDHLLPAPYLWSPRQLQAAAGRLAAWLREHPDHYPPTVPPRPRRAHNYRIDAATVRPLLACLDDLGVDYLTALGVLVDTIAAHLAYTQHAFDEPPADTDHIDPLLLTLDRMCSDLARYGRVGEFTDVDDPAHDTH